MPDGSPTEATNRVEPDASHVGPVSHPLMGTRRGEPAVRRPGTHAPPPINIRVTVPVLGQRFYFAIIGGKERRSEERLAIERQKNPVRTRKNMTFIVVAALVLYLITLGTFLLYSSI